MNSRTMEQCKWNRSRGGGRWFTPNRPIAGGRRWWTLLVIIGVLTLFAERPAWGGEFSLESGPNGIRGYANHATLEKVLDDLAYRNGYVVQIDQDLLEAPTTFSIPAPLPDEQAIQRIVHPHSLALVFRRPAGAQKPVISQIKVFNKGSRSASFALLSGDGPRSVYASCSRQGAVRSAMARSGRVRSGREAFQKHVRPPVAFTTSSMGFTGFKFRKEHSGPDYRPTPTAMAQAYTNYRAERKALDERTQVAKRNSAKLEIEQKKVTYRSGRTPALQKTINESND